MENYWGKRCFVRKADFPTRAASAHPSRVHSFHGVFLLPCLTVYITNYSVMIKSPTPESAYADPNTKAAWKMWSVKEVSLAFYAFGSPSSMNTLQAVLESHSSSKPSSNCGPWLLALAFTPLSNFSEWNSQVFIHLKRNQPPQACFLC